MERQKVAGECRRAIGGESVCVVVACVPMGRERRRSCPRLDQIGWFLPGGVAWKGCTNHRCVLCSD
jgi:hypothetical protein